MSFKVGIGSLGETVFFSGGTLYPSANYDVMWFFNFFVKFWSFFPGLQPLQLSLLVKLFNYQYLYSQFAKGIGFYQPFRHFSSFIVRLHHINYFPGCLFHSVNREFRLIGFVLWDYLFSVHSKFSEKLTFLTL